MATLTPVRLVPPAAALTALVLACVATAAQTPGRGAVALENARAGTPGWLGPQVTDRSAEVYASQTDAVPGDNVALHVSTTPAASYRVLVYRIGWYRGIGGRRVACLPSCTGDEQGSAQPVPAPDPTTGEIVAGWPTTDTLKIGSRWVSGYYQVRVLLTSGPEAGMSADTYVIVRRPASKTAMLVQVPVNTWQAYNSWGGKSLYDLPGLQPRARVVSFDRPYAWFGPGGQGPLGWEVPLVRFIERNGWDVSYQTDVYTDAHPTSLLRHRFVVVAGHDEYWSSRMRDAFDTARDRGVNLAFMDANDAYWQVVMQDGGRSIMSYKSLYDPNPDPSQKTAMFRELTPPRYECELIGIQHQGVGLTWQPGDYTVVDASDPWMHGTGFKDGDTLRGLVSVESDTIPGNQSSASSCGHALTVFFHRDRGGDKDGNADATRYITPAGSAVFASGSHQYSWGLDDFGSIRPRGTASRTGGCSASRATRSTRCSGSELAQARRVSVGELAGRVAPVPVAALRAREVHAGLVAEREHVLERRDRERRARRPGALDQRPRGFVRVETGLALLPGRQRLPPADRGVVVVRPRVDDGAPLVVLQPVRVARAGADGELEDDHAGQLELAPQPQHGRCDHAEVLGDQRQRSELALERVEEGAARAAPPGAVLGGRVPFGHCPVRDEAAEVVDAREVDERQRAPQPLDPPAVARAAHRRPVVEGVAPQLPGRAEQVGWHPGDETGLEELGMRPVVGAAPRHVDRHVAEDAYAALGGVRTQRLPFAFEPHLVLRAPAERDPVVQPVAVGGAEFGQLRRRNGRLRVGEQGRRAGEGGRRHVRRADVVGRPERQDLPPALSRGGEPVDEAIGVLVQYPIREGRRMQQDSG